MFLVAGDKSGDWSGWYDMAIKAAELRFARYLEKREAMSDQAVTWEELRAELVQLGDEQEVARLRDGLVARRRAYRLAEARHELGLR
ncbi:hypothetical protein [Streptosporangium sp. NPDC049078]|uniref:hypothetical protein n=1 Tax=Streptosporangium sp. NPDC049078 TaxID=3155767 RepID=UPI0034389F1B